MPTLYVRNFPEELYQRIRALAAQRHRSLGAEVVVLVERALGDEVVRNRRSQVLKNIARRRRSYVAPPGAADSLSMLHEDRDR